MMEEPEMVTTKRTIDSDTDRYGSFSEVDHYVDDEVKMSSTQIKSPSERTIIPSEKEEERTLVISTPAKPEYGNTSRSAEDMMPSIVKTDEEQVEYVEEEHYYERRDRKIPAAMRNLLVAYLVLIVAVVAGVIATGIVTSAISASVSALEASINAQEEVISLQNSSLEIDAEEVKMAAQDLGMVEYTSTDGTYDVLYELSEDDSSNEFDNLRDEIFNMLN